MKKFTKICLGICLILVGTGLIACIAGISMGFRYNDYSVLARNNAFNTSAWNWMNDFNWNWTNDVVWNGDDVEQGEADFDWEGDDTDWIKQEYSFEESEIKNIDIEYEFGEVNMEPSNSDVIEVVVNYRSIWNTFTRHIDCEVEGNTLKIDDDVDKKILKFKPWNNPANTAYLTIRLPQSKYYKEFKLDTAAGSVNVSTEIKAENISFVVGAGEMNSSSEGYISAEKEIKLESGAGSMQLANIVADELKVNCGVGEIILDNVKAADTKVDCGVGAITMSMAGRETDYDYYLESSIGEVEIGDSSYGGIGNTRNSTTNNGTNNMEINCGIGSVSISFQEQE